MKRRRCTEKPGLFCQQNAGCHNCMVWREKIASSRDWQEKLVKALSGEQLMPVISAFDQRKPDSIVNGVGILVRGQWEVYQEQGRN